MEKTSSLAHKTSDYPASPNVDSKPNPDEVHGIPLDYADDPRVFASGIPVPIDHPSPSSLTFLEPPETESRPRYDREGAALDDLHSLAIAFRHSGWQRNRRLVLESLVRTGQAVSRRTAFAHCGLFAYVLRSIDTPYTYRLAGSSCHDRFCLPCARERSSAIAANVLDRIRGKTLRFVTLTVKSTTETLDDRLNHLYTSFQALRRRSFWTKKVDGGVAFLEVNWSENKQRWHPHLHILIEGRFLHQGALKKNWYGITKDSHIVDIRLVRDPDTAARYITKYASKPFNNTFLNRPNRIDEAVSSLRGRKLCISFGTWRGITLRRPPDDSVWENLGPLEHFLEFSAHDSVWAPLTLKEIVESQQPTAPQRAPPTNDPRPAPAQNSKQTGILPGLDLPTSSHRPQYPQ